MNFRKKFMLVLVILRAKSEEEIEMTEDWQTLTWNNRKEADLLVHKGFCHQLVSNLGHIT